MGHQKSINNNCLLEKSDGVKKEWFHHIQRVQRSNLVSNLGLDLGSDKSDGDKEKEKGIFFLSDDEIPNFSPISYLY